MVVARGYVGHGEPNGKEHEQINRKCVCVVAYRV